MGSPASRRPSCGTPQPGSPQRGARVKAVQRMLGQESAATTLDVYADLFETEPADS
jgi:hypothetical protein